MTPDIISTVTSQKDDFVDQFSKTLISSSLRNIIERSIPFESEDKAALQDNKFKKGLNEITSVIAGDLAQSFQSSGTVPSGSFFDNLVGTVSTYVAMEADNRLQEVINDIKLGVIDTSKLDWKATSYERFEDLKFKNKDIRSRFVDHFKSVLSLEENNVIDEIKEEVKTSIDEAEAKSQIIEETVEELNEVKKEYEQPEKPVVEDKDKDLFKKEESPEESSTEEEPQDEGDETTEEKESVNEETVDQNKDKEEEVTTAEEAAKVYIPITKKQLKNRKKFSVESVTNDFFKSVGDIKQEATIRLNSLKYAIEASPSDKNDEFNYLDEYEEVLELTTEALKNVDSIQDTFLKLGLTQNGIYKPNHVSLEVGKNIITRFINNNKSVSVYPKDYSTENVISNAFDIIQLKRDINSNKYDPSTKSSMINEFEARESAFYKNIVNIDDKEVKEAALNVMKLQDVKLEEVVTSTFVKDYNFNVWESNIGSAKNVQDTVKKNVQKKFEETWGRPLNKDEMDLIEAITNNEDATEIIPTEFEKFVIKFGKEEVTNDTSSESINFKPLTKKRIVFKAKVFTTIYKTLDRLNILKDGDKNRFDSFLNAF